MLSILLQSGIYSYITSPYIVWFPIAVIAALAFIGILAMIYALSTSTGNRRIAVWTKAKIYEVLMGFVLIGAFLFLMFLLTSVNFVQLFNGAGIVPPSCNQPQISSTDLFTLGVCDMYTFNHNITYLNYAMYTIGLRLAFIPGVKVATPNIPGLPGIGVGADIVLVPDAVAKFAGDAIGALYVAFMLTQLQLLLLASGLLLFSLFMVIGLVARMFVITRSFGGALIAFAVGLGIIYPLMVSITYGYVDVGISHTLPYFVGTVISASLGGLLDVLVFVGVPSFISGTVFASVLSYFGLALLGLTFIPLINFVIVDVFIIDFSTAVGEKLDFMSLLTNLV